MLEFLHYRRGQRLQQLAAVDQRDFLVRSGLLAKKNILPGHVCEYDSSLCNEMNSSAANSGNL